MNPHSSPVHGLVVALLGFTVGACGAGEPTEDPDAQAVDGGSTPDAEVSDSADSTDVGTLGDWANDSLQDLLSADTSETGSDDLITTDAPQDPQEEVELAGPLEIELTWFAPADPDPTDSGPGAGPDLDLHFMHPFASDWFDHPFDCFWFNANPNWGSLDPTIPDDPSLLLDSTDGSGPERLAYDTLEVDTLYRIGVHAWSDSGFGPTEATLAISLGGELIHEATVTLQSQEFWEVATLLGPSGNLEVLLNDQGDPLVLSDYMNPLF